MVESEKFAIAARLYVLLKRKTGRSIDAAHVINNKGYAREVIATARGAADPDLDMLLDRFEIEMFGKATRPALVNPEAAEASPKQPSVAVPGKYIGMLR